MRTALILVLMLLFPVFPATAGVSIGINLQVYPDFAPVPNYPVYYAPRLAANYFFYDGSYWVFSDDNWYVSSWYNGPWEMMDPYAVPVFILRIPVRYYRHAPSYFRSWQPSAPPRWGDHWGRDWSQRRSGWDRWNHKSVPARPPLPVYQRKYSGRRRYTARTTTTSRATRPCANRTVSTSSPHPTRATRMDVRVKVLRKRKSRSGGATRKRTARSQARAITTTARTRLTNVMWAMLPQ
jgi:hypothetical protein